MKKVASHKSMRKKEQVTSHDNVMKGGQGQEIHLHYVNHPLHIIIDAINASSTDSLPSFTFRHLQTKTTKIDHV
jgi:hypothetical protein